MSDISEWSTIEAENTHLDELTLSGESGQYINKIMCAVKDKMNEVDGKLDAVAGGLVFRGTKATYADLEAVTDPASGDMYSVTALGGSNFAWNGTEWDDLGTSDANVVHKTDNETISGDKTFTGNVGIAKERPAFSLSNSQYEKASASSGDGHGILWKDKNGVTAAEIIELYFGSTNKNVSLRFDVFSFHSSDATAYSRLEFARQESNSIFAPMADETFLGTSGHRFGQIYTTDTVNVGSDERIKTAMEPFPDSVLDAWGEVQFGQYQLLSSVERKGEAARFHSGLIAQRIAEAFQRHGLDASRYGLFCFDQWPAEPEERDEQGRVVQEAVPAGELYSLRYEECLCMEAAYQRRRADRLEARIAALEARFDGE